MLGAWLSPLLQPLRGVGLRGGAQALHRVHDVALLPEDYRGAFLLRDVEGLSNEQIAKAMKLSVPAVKSRIHRARVFLRNELATYFAKGRRDN